MDSSVNVTHSFAVDINFIFNKIYTKDYHKRIPKLFLKVKREMLLTHLFILKVVSTTFSLVCFLCLKESTCETRKNIFYFTSNALFVFEIIKF